MKLQFDGNQPFQLAAVQAVLDLFDGQPRSEATSSPLQLKDYGPMFRGQVQTDLGVGNHLLLDDERLLRNTRAVQLRNDIEVGDERSPLSSWELFDAPANMSRLCPHFAVEMETGTGKTYVYLRTIRELSRRYGWRKFVIVVPSIAIREGVLKNLEVTAEHFGDLFDHEPCEFFVYSSKDLNRLRQFATANTLQIMVINIDAFRKDAEGTGDGQASTPNVIYKQIDRMSGHRPIDFMQAARPIVVLDEPQSIDNTEKAQAAIQRLNPLCTLRYSATHRDEHNLVYRLDPVRAFELKLVKQIVVASVGAEGGANAAFVRVEGVDNTKGIKAKLAVHVAGKDGPRVKSITVRQGDDLFDKSGERECYRDGFKVVEINTRFEDGELLDYLSSLQVNPKKSLYEYVEYDSEVERAFAKALNERSDIRLFVKLPRWFVVDTPVGAYNPDWAIVKSDSSTVYMVRETKGTRDFRKRRGVENDKVRCGERHFDALGVSFDVVTSVDEIR